MNRGRRGEFLESITRMKRLLMRFRPSPFVLSNEGETAQRKIWDETIALLKKEAKDLDTLFP